MDNLMTLLNFIFRDFWTFCGVVILLYIIGVYCIAAPISAIACIFSGNSCEESKKDDVKENEKEKKNKKG